ncbi:MAG TPA: NAD-dependent epimerase/dehydratase family protein [Anaerolineae bacterium]|nr:NAD-dependent epimerase/dehydratase family protein [Anaerolineae bacterium]
MTLAGKTVLVTGGTGFVGGRLVEKLVLEQQARVRVLVRNFSTASRIARFPIEMVGGDVADTAVVQKAVQGCEVVFNCAHEGSLKKEQQKALTLQSAQNLGEASLQAGVSRFVHVSTFAVYGPTLDGNLTELSPWQPSDHSYIQAKRAAETLMLDWQQQKGLPVVVLQPTIVYGPFCKPWTLKPITDLKTGLVPLVNGGHGYCNGVYIDDVVEAMILAATQPDILGETFLISGPEPVSWKIFYNAFETALGIQATIDITDGELKLLEGRQMSGKSLKARLLRLARSRRVTKRVNKVPPLRGSLKILEKYLSADQAPLPAYPGQNGSGGHREDKQPGMPVHIPNETLLALYRSQTWVRIDKAQKLLGYTPKFDFERGMDLTTQFIQWANLRA